MLVSAWLQAEKPQLCTRICICTLCAHYRPIGLGHRKSDLDTTIAGHRLILLLDTKLASSFCWTQNASYWTVVIAQKGPTLSVTILVVP